MKELKFLPRRIIALVLIFMMTFGALTASLIAMLPMSVLAAVDQVAHDQVHETGGVKYYNATGGEIECETHGDDPCDCNFKEDDDCWVIISKEIEQIEKTDGSDKIENAFEITLTVETRTKELTDTIPADASVVLVLDMSGSMWFCATCGGGSNGSLGYHTYVTQGSGNNTTYKSTCPNHASDTFTTGGRVSITESETRWYAVRQAAIEFIEKFAENGVKNGTSRYVSIVIFGSSGIAVPITAAGVGPTITTTDVTPESESKYWWDVATPNGNKAITDYLKNLKGFTNSSNTQMNGYYTNVESGLAVARNLYIKSGVTDTNTRILPITSRGEITNNNVVLFTDGVPNRGGSSDTSYSTSNTNLALSGSGNYSLSQAQSRTDEILQGSTARHSASVYGIAYEQKAADVDTLKYICRYEKDTRENVWQASTANINLVFEEVADAIIKYADAWLVFDQMGPDNIIWDSDNELDNAQEFIDGELLKWDLKKEKNFETNGDWKKYTYTYKVILDTLDENFEKGAVIQTNGDTYLKYRIMEDDTPIGDGDDDEGFYTAEFTIPAIGGFDGEIVLFKKVGSDGEPLEGVMFKLYHDNANCSCGRVLTDNEIEELAKEYESDEGGLVRLDKIPSGHSHLLVEFKYDEEENEDLKNYILDSTPYQISVEWGKVVENHIPIVKGTLLCVGDCGCKCDADNSYDDCGCECTACIANGGCHEYLITNDHKPEIIIKKVWIDANGVEYSGANDDGSYDENTVSFTNIDKTIEWDYDINTVEVGTYTIVENEITNWVFEKVTVKEVSETNSGTTSTTNLATIPAQPNKTYIVTFYNQLNLVPFTFNKSWVDDGVGRPNKITVELWKAGSTALNSSVVASGDIWLVAPNAVPKIGGYPYKVKLTDPNTWEVTINGLNPNEKYFIKEVEVDDDYITEKTVNSEGNTIITNTKKIPFTFTKSWDDGSGDWAKENRPTSIAVTFKDRDGNTVASGAIPNLDEPGKIGGYNYEINTTDSDNWVITINGLNPNIAPYTVTETVPNKYTASGNPANHGGTITNSRIPVPAVINIEKTILFKKCGIIINNIKQLTCGIIYNDHVHTDVCYSEEDPEHITPICNQDLLHTHIESCYESVPNHEHTYGEDGCMPNLLNPLDPSATFTFELFDGRRNGVKVGDYSESIRFDEEDEIEPLENKYYTANDAGKITISAADLAELLGGEEEVTLYVKEINANANGWRLIRGPQYRVVHINRFGEVWYAGEAESAEFTNGFRPDEPEQNFITINKRVYNSRLANTLMFNIPEKAKFEFEILINDVPFKVVTLEKENFRFGVASTEPIELPYGVELSAVKVREISATGGDFSWSGDNGGEAKPVDVEIGSVTFKNYYNEEVIPAITIIKKVEDTGSQVAAPSIKFYFDLYEVGKRNPVATFDITGDNTENPLAIKLDGIDGPDYTNATTILILRELDASDLFWDYNTSNAEYYITIVAGRIISVVSGRNVSLVNNNIAVCSFTNTYYKATPEITIEKEIKDITGNAPSVLPDFTFGLYDSLEEDAVAVAKFTITGAELAASEDGKATKTIALDGGEDNRPNYTNANAKLYLKEEPTDGVSEYWTYSETVYEITINRGKVESIVVVDAQETDTGEEVDEITVCSFTNEYYKKTPEIGITKIVSTRSGSTYSAPTGIIFTFELYDYAREDLYDEETEKYLPLSPSYTITTNGNGTYNHATIPLSYYTNADAELTLIEKQDRTSTSWTYDERVYTIKIVKGEVKELSYVRNNQAPVIVSKANNAYIAIFENSYFNERIVTTTTTTTEESTTTTEGTTTAEVVTTTTGTTTEVVTTTEDVTTTEPTIEVTTTEEFVEETNPTVPLVDITFPDEPEETTVPTTEETIEEEPENPPVPLVDSVFVEKEPEEVRENPKTGNILPLILVMTLILSVGTTAFIYTLKRPYKIK